MIAIGLVGGGGEAPAPFPDVAGPLHWFDRACLVVLAAFPVAAGGMVVWELVAA